MQTVWPKKKLDEIFNPIYEDHFNDENDITCYCMDAVRDPYLPDGLVHLHWHNAVEIMLCIKGTARVRIEEEEYALNCGQALFVQSGQMHSGGVISPGGCVLICFVINERFHMFMRSACPADWPTLRLFEPNIALPARIEDSGITEMLFDALDAVKDRGDRAHIRLRLFMGLILERMAANCGWDIRFTREHTNVSEVRGIIDHIGRHCAERITLSQLSSRFSVSEETVYRLFKRYTGLSPISFVNKTRMHRACMYLIHTRLSVSEVAEACGFEDGNYFTRRFRMAYGITPLKYRAQYTAHPSTRILGRE